MSIPQASLLFPTEGARVLIVLNGFRVADLDWERARLLGRALQRPREIEPPSPFSFRIELDRLFVGMGDAILFGDLPYDAAAQAGQILIMQAGAAEESAKAEQIIADQALATRAGLNFGLSNNPKILEAAKSEAFHNRELRLAIPTMRGTAMYGTPGVKQYSPDPHVGALEQLADMTPEQRKALAEQAIKESACPTSQP